VIDGQHRLAAARLRGDIQQLPAVVVSYASQADEAASFVKLNQQRKPLGKLDLFGAAIASGDTEACGVLAAIEAAGLSLAPHENYISWKPGMVANIGGIEAAWRKRGPKVTELALRIMAGAFAGQVLRYAGTLFPGIAAVAHDEVLGHTGTFAPDRAERFQTMLALREQTAWRGDVMVARADNPGLRFDDASAQVMRNAWSRASGDPKPVQARAGAAPAAAGPGGKHWCTQCEAMVTTAEAAGCKSRFCGLKAAA